MRVFLGRSYPTYKMYSLPKEERLNKKKNIQHLFAQRKRWSGQWLALYYAPHIETQHPPQVLFSVPKSRIRKAVVRNGIRRRMKEAYRLHKQILTSLSTGPPSLLLGYVYIGGGYPLPSYQLIQKEVIASLHHLVSKFKKQ